MKYDYLLTRKTKNIVFLQLNLGVISLGLIGILWVVTRSYADWKKLSESKK